MASQKKSDNIFLHMHPLHRIGISLLLALITYLLLPKNGMSVLFVTMALWVVFSFSYLLTSWIIVFTRPVPEIRKKAISDDGSAVFVMIMILLSSFASMFTVLLLMIGKHSSPNNHSLFVPVSLGGMLLSWILVHTVFTFHYAHKYYDNDEQEASKAAEGIDFPGKGKPDYLDFAYFSFVIGCTFQVSDVEVSSQKIRRIVLVHGLLSFALNTFVVALTINFVGSLMN